MIRSLRRVKTLSHEGRARIATLICRGFGWLLILTASFLIGAGAMNTRDRIGPMAGGLAALLLGVAFLAAKPITAEHLASGVDDL
jgi:hypothetical protein